MILAMSFYKKKKGRNSAMNQPCLKITTDFIFKRIFTKKKFLLIHLLNSLLNLENEKEIEDLELMNPEEKESLEDQKSIMDLRAQDKKKNIYNIEIQLQPHKAYLERILRYQCKNYIQSNTMEKGFHENPYVYHISILDFDLFKEDLIYHHTFKILSPQNLLIDFSNKFQFDIFELRKFKIQDYKLLKAKLEKWIFFFKNSDTQNESLMNTFYNDPLLKEAYEELQKISLDPKNRHLYDQKEKWIMLELTKKHEMEEEKLLKFQEGKAEGRALGRAEGREEGKAEGVLEGMNKGKVNSLITILKLKFKDFDTQDELLINNNSKEEILDLAIKLSVTCEDLKSILQLFR